MTDLAILNSDALVFFIQKSKFSDRKTYFNIVVFLTDCLTECSNLIFCTLFNISFTQA